MFLGLGSACWPDVELLFTVVETAATAAAAAARVDEPRKLREGTEEEVVVLVVRDEGNEFERSDEAATGDWADEVWLSDELAEGPSDDEDREGS